MTNSIAKSRSLTVFACLETTKGTAVFPSSAAELIVCAGQPTINQQPAFTNSPEIYNSRDVLARFQDQAGAGTFTIPTIVRPSGSLGSVPMCGPLFKSLMGTETINASTSVVYSQALTKPSVTIWMLKDHTCFWARGGVVTRLRTEARNTGGAMCDFEGEFMQMGWAGTDAVNGAVSGSTSVVVDDAKKYTAGSYVKFDDDDNTGAGYRIASVDTDTNTLTMDDSITCDDDAVIAPFLPDSYTAIGTALESRKTSVEIDAVASTIKRVSLDLGDPVQMQTDEITSSDYPEDYVEGERAITGTIEKNLRQNEVKDWTDGYAGNSVDMDLIYGTVAGDIMTISLPQTSLEVPAMNDTAPTVSMTTSFTCLGSSGEDSCTITFT